VWVPRHRLRVGYEGAQKQEGLIKGSSWPSGHYDSMRNKISDVKAWRPGFNSDLMPYYRSGPVAGR
jgi:hypothetical protein